MTVAPAIEEDRAPRNPPTMSDVARRAGVSHQTVSRVIGNHPYVREETRAKVLRAIDDLGYRPNSSARALVTRRTRAIGVVACHPTLYGPASTLLGLEQAARAEGYLVSAVHLRRHTPNALAEAVDHLVDWGADGIVVIVPQREVVSALAELRVPCPVVTVGGGHDLHFSNVSVDQQLGAREVTRYLLTGGHRTVWHLAGPAGWLEAEARTEGWRSVLEQAGAEIPPLLVGDWSPQSGYRVGHELARRVGSADGHRGTTGPTAVFVANDQMALGLLRAFREARVAVPGQVAVAGFDDIPEAEYFFPPLTTVRQDFMAVGRESIRLLFGQLDAGLLGSPERVVIQPRLIIRSSSRSCPA
jgi:DNA-binding LacI/PurR family transcriptional regulator